MEDDEIEMMELTPTMDRAEGASARVHDLNGFFEVQDNPLSKVGVFQYLGRNIPQEAERGNGKSVFAVYRPAEELSDPECLASFRLVPWVIDHTMIGDGMLGTMTVEEKGARGVTGEQIWFDESSGTLYGNIKCFSSILAGQIAAGKTPLSLGYRCVYQYAPGVFNGIPYTYIQRRIRGNHLATVDDGRMGPEVAVMDGSDLIPTEKSKMKKKYALIKAKTQAGQLHNKLMAVAMDAEDKVADESTSEEDKGELQEAIAAIESVAPLLAAVDELKSVGNVDELAVTGDEEDEDKDKGKDKDKPAQGMDAAEVARIVDRAVAKALAGVRPAATMDASDVVKAVASRDKLASQLSEFVGAFDHSEMTAQGVAEYGVAKLEIPGVAKGQEIGAVTAFMHARTPARFQQVAHAGDSKDRAAKSFLAAQVAERS